MIMPTNETKKMFNTCVLCSQLRKLSLLLVGKELKTCPLPQLKMSTISKVFFENEYSNWFTCRFDMERIGELLKT